MVPASPPSLPQINFLPDFSLFLSASVLSVTPPGQTFFIPPLDHFSTWQIDTLFLGSPALINFPTVTRLVFLSHSITTLSLFCLYPFDSFP